MSIRHKLEKLWGQDCCHNKRRRTEYHSLRCYYDSLMIQTIDYPKDVEFINIKSTIYSSILLLSLFWELPRAPSAAEKNENMSASIFICCSCNWNCLDFKLLYYLQGKPFFSMNLLCFASSFHLRGHVFVERHHVVGRRCWKHSVCCCLSLFSSSQLTSIICRQCIQWCPSQGLRLLLVLGSGNG